MILKSIVYRGVKIEIARCDITEEEVDVIVNAANTHLQHGGGVAGAIVRKGGYEIQRESDEIVKKRGPVATGEAVHTTAGKLKAKYVIHAVGPIWRGRGDENELLYRAVLNSLILADKLGAKSISIPTISTGIYGFPKKRAVPIFARAVKDFVDEHRDSKIKLIRICSIDAETSKIFAEGFEISEG